MDKDSMNLGPFRLGLALEGTGWHPASWLLSSVTDAGEVFTGGYWTDWGRAAASGGIDFVTLEDGLSLQTDTFAIADQARDRVHGRLDPVVTAAVLLATTDISKVVVSCNVTHTNPFHVAVQLASLAAIGPGPGGVAAADLRRRARCHRGRWTGDASTAARGGVRPHPHRAPAPGPLS
ncbi:hypothetical protein ABT040_21905 [Streptomyces sp. NPDC002688]|uniref:hypothetical protein n=1 Tax=Streptomyces sp. NPDC002688 TaxID=3154423 RepID=UPI003320DD6B